MIHSVICTTLSILLLPFVAFFLVLGLHCPFSRSIFLVGCISSAMPYLPRVPGMLWLFGKSVKSIQKRPFVTPMALVVSVLGLFVVLLVRWMTMFDSYYHSGHQLQNAQGFVCVIKHRKINKIVSGASSAQPARQSQNSRCSC